MPAIFHMKHRAEQLHSLSFSLFAMMAVWGVSSSFDFALMTQWSKVDVWFNADIPRVFSNLTILEHGHGGTYKHPLFSILLYPIVNGVNVIVDNIMLSVRIVLSLNAGLFFFLLNHLLRQRVTSLVDRTLILLLTMSSSAFIFWFSVPETFAFGATTILLSLCLINTRKRGGLYGSIVDVVLCAASLTMTITNWIVGIFSVAFRYGVFGKLYTWAHSPVRQYFRLYNIIKEPTTIIIMSAGVVLIFAFLQDYIFGGAGMFINVFSLYGETKFFAGLSVSEMAERIFNLFISPVVFGTQYSHELTAIPNLAPARIGVEVSNLTFNSVSQTIAITGWVAAFFIGVCVNANSLKKDILLITSVVSLLVFTVLHLIYGSSYFLYVAHFLPLLMIICGNEAQGKYRLFWRSSVSIAIIFSLIYNLSEFHRISGYISGISTV